MTTVHPCGNQVEAVVINWKRPRNVAAIVSALRRQTAPCTITVCDCHDSPEFQLPPDALPAIDRVYRWKHNLGAFSRYVPIGGYDHKYTLFIDDDMLPGERCVEHFLAWAEQLREFGALGQLGRILDPDGTYRMGDIARGPGFTEVDIIVRALLVRTGCLVHVPQIRNLLDEFGDPEDDILLSVGLAMYAGLSCYLTPYDPDPETLVNVYELDSPHSRSTRPHHLAARSRLLHSAMNLGWQPIRSRRQSESVTAHNDAVPEPSSGVLYLAIGDEDRKLAVASISALRRYGYSGPIRVVTDAPDWLLARFECQTVAVPEIGTDNARCYYKTRLFEFAFESTLFLDPGAIPIGDISDVWGYLGDRNIAMAADLRPNVSDLIRHAGHERGREECELMIRLGLTSRTFYSSAVMLFRRSAAVAALFASWHEEWKRFAEMDQMALVRAEALTGTPVRTLPVTWNCSARQFASIRQAQAAGVKMLHFESSDRSILTVGLASALSDVDRYPPGGEWELLGLCEGGALARTDGSYGPSRRHGRGGGFLVDTNFGVTGSLELVIPGPCGGAVNYRISRDAPHDSWGDPIIIGETWGKVDSANLVQSDVGHQENFELVIRVGARLGHSWRESARDAQWQRVSWFADGVAGNPSFIQSDYGRIGNLELVVPCISGGVAHCWRSNDDPPQSWIEGGIFAMDMGRVDAVALIQSALDQGGNLEVIVRVGDELAHYWRSPQSKIWRGPTFFFSGAAGIPGFIQGANGEPGNFELLTPVADGGIAHLSRDNHSAYHPWKMTSYIDRVGAPAEAVSLIQGKGGNSQLGDLEAVARGGDEVKWYRWDEQSGKWSCISRWSTNV